VAPVSSTSRPRGAARTPKSPRAVARDPVRAADPYAREVSGGKDIAGIHRALQVDGPGQRRGIQHAIQKALANFADAVVVGERAAAPQNFVAGGALQLGINRIGVGDALAVKGEVKVNANAGVVELGNAGR